MFIRVSSYLELLHEFALRPEFSTFGQQEGSVQRRVLRTMKKNKIKEKQTLQIVFPLHFGLVFANSIIYRTNF